MKFFGLFLIFSILTYEIQGLGLLVNEKSIFQDLNQRFANSKPKLASTMKKLMLPKSLKSLVNFFFPKRVLKKKPEASTKKVVIFGILDGKINKVEVPVIKHQFSGFGGKK